MSVYFDAASSQYLTRTGFYQLNNASNFTVGFWAKPDSTATDQIQTVWQFRKAGSTDYYRIDWYTGDDDPPANPQWRVYIYDGTTTVTMAYTPPNWNWQHIALRCEFSGTHVWAGLYHNGVQRDTDDTDLDMDALDWMVLGARRGALTYSNYYDGYLAEVCHWFSGTGTNYEISDIQIAAMAKGFSPWNVKPQTVSGFYPLRSAACFDKMDLSGVAALTASASAPTIDSSVHPAVQLVPRPTVRPGATKRREVFIGGILQQVT